MDDREHLLVGHILLLPPSDEREREETGAPPSLPSSHPCRTRDVAVSQFRPPSPAVTSEEVEGGRREGREWNADCRPQSLTCYISHRQVADQSVFCARKVAVRGSKFRADVAAMSLLYSKTRCRLQGSTDRLSYQGRELGDTLHCASSREHFLPFSASAIALQFCT